MVIGLIYSNLNLNIPIMSYDLYTLFILVYRNSSFSYSCHIFWFVKKPTNVDASVFITLFNLWLAGVSECCQIKFSCCHILFIWLVRFWQILQDKQFSAISYCCISSDSIHIRDNAYMSVSFVFLFWFTSTEALMSGFIFHSYCFHMKECLSGNSYEFTYA